MIFMKDLFDNVSAKCSRITTRNYSTSFSLGIHFLGKKFRDPICGIYGFVRFADEIVDSFHGYNKSLLLQKFRNDTIAAIEDHISLNPILNSFQHTYHQYKIEWDLVDTFLRSMEMDLHHQLYDQKKYDQYIFGSAEAVGLMCLRVFSECNDTTYQKLKPAAMKLGAAFQKVNFLRDSKNDFEVLGRTYFPGVNMNQFSSADKIKIEHDIENDFRNALHGIRQLPASSRRGVYLAYIYYYRLFIKIKALPPGEILNRRIRIHNYNKIALMFKSLLRYKLDLL